jgi:hypothetical protein
LFKEVVVGLGLLERGLPVLTDHHKGRQEDRFEDTTRVSIGHEVCRLEKQHPDSEGGGVQADEEHRTGERRDGVATAVASEPLVTSPHTACRRRRNR